MLMIYTSVFVGGAASAKEEAAVGTAKPRHDKSRARAGMCPVRHSGQRSSVFKAM